jgi:hypothetical protein
MPQITHVKKAQQRYAQVPVLNDDGTPKESPVFRKDGSPKLTKQGRPITMRVTVADKSQPLPPHTCGACGQPIEVGTAYKHVSIKSGPYGGRTLYRHEGCPTWRPSELTTSKMAGVYAAQEMAEDQIDGCETVDDLQALAADVASQVRDVAEE